ncbi:MAG TPA: type II toxin-antitoxin system VapC family toxin [Gemmataceae bacterium]|nr:type II toxin-antitoxin system VapC family toxin [Gemmataceae bacterium]
MLFLLDTDNFSLYLGGNLKVLGQVIRHPVADLALSIISVEELWSGWWTATRQAKNAPHAALAYNRLTEVVNELKNWPVVSFPEPAIRRYHTLKRQKLNVGGNDLKIAAIALEASAIVVTRNVRDFGRVAGLTLEDWSQ